MIDPSPCLPISSLRKLLLLAVSVGVEVEEVLVCWVGVADSSRRTFYGLVYTLALGSDGVETYRHSSALSFHTRSNGAVNDVAEGVKLGEFILLALCVALVNGLVYVSILTVKAGYVDLHCR
jgi:hypothetical protein